MRVKNLTFSNMEPLVKNPMISKGYVDIAYAGKNRNRSFISDDVMHTRLEPSVLGVPIVGEFFEEVEDFGDHGGRLIIDNNGMHYEATTIPYGFVPPNAELTYISKVDKDNVERKYLRADCFLWTGQYPECDRVLKTGNPQSMELERDTGYWKRIDGEDYYVIEDAIISKLCILGTEVEPCFEGAAFGQDKETASVSYALDKEKYDDFIKNFALEVKKALESDQEEGGQSMSLEEEKIEEKEPLTDETFAENNEEKQEEVKEEFTEEKVEEEVVEEKAEEFTEEVEEKVEETEEAKTEEFTEEVVEEETPDLSAVIQELTMSLEKANEALEVLKAENKELHSFKAKIELEEKKELLNKFKAKIDEADFEDLSSKVESLSYDLLEADLCKLFTNKMLSKETESETKIEAVKTFSVDKDIVVNKVESWEERVFAKQSK